MRRARRTASLTAIALLAIACGPRDPLEGRFAGAPGTSFATFIARSNGIEPFEVDVYFPAEDAKPVGSSLPALVLVPGGRVPRESYRWLGEALALRGVVTAVPEAPYDLAILDAARVPATAELLRSGRGLLSGLVGPKLAVGGHSLGGVVAAAAAVDGGFDALVLLAAYPASGDPVESLQIPSLSIAASRDCSAELDDVRAGWQRLPAPTILATVLGSTHYQFTASDEQDREDCPPEVTLDVAHQRIARVAAEFLNAVLEEEGGLPRIAVEGVSIEVRR